MGVMSVGKQHGRVSGGSSNNKATACKAGIPESPSNLLDSREYCLSSNQSHSARPSYIPPFVNQHRASFPSDAAEHMLPCLR